MKFLLYDITCIVVQKRQGKSKVLQRGQCIQESEYMDPSRGLCLGALVDIAATNVSMFTSHLAFIMLG